LKQPAQLAAGGISIAALKVRDEILIACDSMLAAQFGNPVRAEQKLIGIRKEVLFAATGLTTCTSSSFNVFEIASRSYYGESTLAGCAAAFRRHIKTPLKAFLLTLKTTSRERFDEGKRCALEAVFAKYEGEPRLTSILFKFHENSDGSIELEDLVCDAPAGDWIECFGSKRAIQALMDVPPSSFSVASLSEKARMMIQAEIDANPLQVGPPIYVASAHRGGITWHLRPTVRSTS
jgi:hypothetical protein